MIMKTKAILLGTAALMFTLTSEKAIAQIGTPYIHDPSTIMETARIICILIRTIMTQYTRNIAAYYQISEKRVA